MGGTGKWTEKGKTLVTEPSQIQTGALERSGGASEWSGQLGAKETCKGGQEPKNKKRGK